jgi:hypothetical protein
MADNNFNPKNDISQFYKRTNPLTPEANGMKMKVEKPYCPILDVVCEFDINTGAGTVTFNAAGPMAAYDVRYLTVNIKDENGNEGSNTTTGVLSGPLVVDVSKLDPNLTWYIQLTFSDSEGLLIDCDCTTFGELKVENAASDPSIDISTIEQQSPISGVFEADGTTPVADGGAAYALGSFAAGGTTEEALVIVKNSGATVLEISEAVLSGQVLSIVNNLPSFVYVDGELALKFNIDSSGGAGPYSGSITLATNDSQNPAYVINVTYTLA